MPTGSREISNKQERMHIYLIGYRGSGKSTVGKLLAAQLNLSFVDSDRLIESAGKSIKEIFAQVGEAGFRDCEQAAVREISERNERHVVGLGGGAILRPENRAVIAATGRCAWLRGSAETLYQRINADAHSAVSRPNLTADGGYNEVVDMLARREALYEEAADFVVQTDGRSPDEIVLELADWAESSKQ